MTPSPGTRLGPYEILSILGAGGMGEVYRAKDTRLDREVAVKVLPEALAMDADARKRFEREAKAVAALSHPNILAIHDFGFHEGIAYAVTELLEGETLRDRLEAGPLPQKRAIEIALQTARGMAAAHQKGIVHRDLKPENLFLTKDERVKILDFGLAKQGHSPGDADGATSAPTEDRHTEPGTVLGTVGYMSPEQVRGLAVDRRSDIFSFGAIFYEMLSGRKAFKRKTPADTMSAILKEEPPELSESAPSVSPAVDQIVQHCLDKNPESRFQSAHDIAFALEKLTASGPSAATAAAPRLRTGSVLLAAAAAAAIVAAAMLFWVRRPRTDAAAARKSIAVLPFVNGSSDKENEYFSDGITEDLINQLSKVSGLRVAARTSAFAFKGKNEDVRAIGKALNVGAVLEGNVSRAGDHVRISAQLIDTDNGYSLWSESYDRKLEDIFALRSQLAQTVADALKVKLLVGERQKLEKKPTEDLEAYQLYLKGRHEIASFTPAGLNAGIRHLQQAISRDPNYALAHLGVAYYYVSVIDLMKGEEALPRARAAAEKALSLDPSLAEAHADLGWIAFLERDDATADREMRAAIEMQPELAYAHEVYGWFLVAVGRTDRGLAEAHRAVELDPLSSETNTLLGFNLYFARRYDDAIRQLRTTVAMDPDYYWGREVLGRAYARTGKLPEALAELRSARRAAGSWISEIESAFGPVSTEMGNRSEALAMLADMREHAKTEYVPAYYFATVYAALGDKDSAFARLAQAVEERSVWTGWFGVDPDLDSLRSDPRFAALLKKMKLPPP